MGNKKKEKEQRPPKCGNCIECVRTYLGCYCGLSDNPVNEADEGCIDFIAEDPDYE